MATGVLGNPLVRGKSDIIETAVFDPDSFSNITAGIACTLAGEDEHGNNVIVPFDGSSFFGFIVANDLNTRQSTVSVIRAGFKIPVVPGGTAPTGNVAVGLDSDGKVVDAAASVFSLNAENRLDKQGQTITALNEKSVAVAAVTIDLDLGGAPSGSPAS